MNGTYFRTIHASRPTSTDFGEMNPASPSATVNTPADRELARTYLTKHAPDLIDMVLGSNR